jgi:hypothetical protein
VPELLDNFLGDSSLHPNNKRIGHGNFDIFCLSHNNDNGGNESICTYLANSCNGIRLDDLLVGNIIDNGILLARKILLHQNQLCNAPILTLFESLVVFFIDGLCVGNDRTES